MNLDRFTDILDETEGPGKEEPAPSSPTTIKKFIANLPDLSGYPMDSQIAQQYSNGISGGHALAICDEHLQFEQAQKGTFHVEDPWCGEVNIIYSKHFGGREFRIVMKVHEDQLKLSNSPILSHIYRQLVTLMGEQLEKESGSPSEADLNFALGGIL